MRITVNETQRTFDISLIGVSDRYPMAFIHLRKISNTNAVEKNGQLTKISGRFDNARDANFFMQGIDILWNSNQKIEGLATAKEVAEKVVAQFSPVSPALTTISWPPQVSGGQQLQSTTVVPIATDAKKFT
jgi:hypothetical protein